MTFPSRPRQELRQDRLSVAEIADSDRQLAESATSEIRIAEFRGWQTEHGLCTAERVSYAPDPTIGVVIASAVDVHKVFGPGLLESTYQRCLAYEFALRSVPFLQQVALPISYKGLPTDCGYRLDFVVDRTVIVELKCVDRLAPIHSAQLLTYLKLSQTKRGLLINFNVPRLVDGVRSIVL